MSIRYLTAGESHGKGLMGILEGMPSHLEITSEYIQAQMKRRKLGFGRGARQQIESDSVEIFSPGKKASCTWEPGKCPA